MIEAGDVQYAGLEQGDFRLGVLQSSSKLELCFYKDRVELMLTLGA